MPVRVLRSIIAALVVLGLCVAPSHAASTNVRGQAPMVRTARTGVLKVLAGASVAGVVATIAFVQVPAARLELQMKSATAHGDTAAATKAAREYLDRFPYSTSSGAVMAMYILDQQKKDAAK
jgi:hypothetical protein